MTDSVHVMLIGAGADVEDGQLHACVIEDARPLRRMKVKVSLREPHTSYLEGILGLGDGEWSVSFQSRVGREEWLRPYTDEHLKSLAANGLRQVDVVCPGFSADCLETLEEIAVENAGYFTEAGGERLSYIPALNARRDHLSFLTQLVLRHLQGWPETSPAWDEESRRKALEESAARASAAGA